MIVRMQTGSSFAGAALYYFHDKRDPSELIRLTTERIAWTLTHNCASNDHDNAISEMIAVADFQTELKREAGHGLGGRPCEDPVLTVSLSWRPHVEKPTKEHMQQTAHDFLEHMGLHEHQAVILAHNDTAHQHVHLIVNRIHPREGLVYDDSYDHNRAMRWREGYERGHGIIHETDRAAEKHQHKHNDFARDARDIQQRYEKIAELGAHQMLLAEVSRRAQPDKTQLRRSREPNRYPDLAKTHQRTLQASERHQLAQRHNEEREEFLKSNKLQFKQARNAAYHATREAFASRWSGMYREEQELMQELKTLRAEMAQRAMAFARDGQFVEAWQSIHQPSEARLERDQRLTEIQKARTALHTEQRDVARESQDAACKALITQRDREFTAIKDRQAQDRGELHGIQTARAHDEPYSQLRLQELLHPHARTFDRAYESIIAQREQTDPDHPRAINYQSLIGEHEQRAADQLRDSAVKSEPTVTKQNRPGIEPEPTHDQPDKSARRDATDGIAGGIGKLVEIAADVMGALIAPETEQDRSQREAQVQAEAEHAPEREAAAEAQIQAERQNAYEGQTSSLEKIDAYFTRHADRIRKEQEFERAKQRGEKDR